MSNNHSKIAKGSIVKSKSGHDGGSFYLVVELKDGYCYIADGRSRKLCKPKRKNPIHLAATSRVVEISEIDTDLKIRRVLWDYNFGSPNSVSE